MEHSMGISPQAVKSPSSVQSRNVKEPEDIQHDTYASELDEHLHTQKVDWDAVEQQYKASLFWRRWLRNAAGSLTMIFVLYLLWARWFQLRQSIPHGGTMHTSMEQIQDDVTDQCQPEELVSVSCIKPTTKASCKVAQNGMPTKQKKMRKVKD